MRIKQVLIILILLWSNYVNGQLKENNINIGDSLPIFKIPKTIYSVKKVISTKDYKDQLLIIDFWSTGCSGCVEALPKMEALQKHFGNKITILPVTFEKENYTLEFLKNNKFTKHLTLPSVVEDQIFSKYFKHKSIPHEVWIYKGKVIAITEAEYVDENNIQKVLNNNQIDWPLKYDFYSFDESKPLFDFNRKKIGDSTPVSYVCISDAREKFSSSLLPGRSGIIRDSIKKTIRTYFLNQSIFAAYLNNWMKIKKGMLMVKPNGIEANQVVWEVVDKSRYKYDEQLGYRQDWMIKNAICFESLCRDTGQTDLQVYNSVIMDMNRLLGLSVRWEKRKEKVLIITKISVNKKNIKINLGEKYSINSIVYNLNKEPNNPYVFNENNDNNNEEIWLNSVSWNDLATIRKELQKYNFDLKEEEREVDKLVFSETNGSNLVDGQMQLRARYRSNLSKKAENASQQYGETFLELNKHNSGVKMTPSGLEYKILEEGKGARPKMTDSVRVHYEGRLLNGKIFDSSYERGRPIDLEMHSLIKGWTEALQMMQEGAKWELYIPAELAYGSHTAQGTIPPNSTLIFDIYLLKVLP